MLNYPGFMSAELLQPALTELPALLTEADLHIAQLSLTVLSSVCHLAQPAAALVQSGFMVKVRRHALVWPPPLQGWVMCSHVQRCCSVLADCNSFAHNDGIQILPQILEDFIQTLFPGSL